MTAKAPIKYFGGKYRFVDWIEHIDGIDCIRKYAYPKSLIYCDPPYPIKSRSSGANVYRYEMTDDQHVELVRTLLEVPGHKVLSSYENPLYQPLLDAGWSLEKKEVVCTVSGGTKGTAHISREQKTRTECLYCSPGRKGLLFD